MKQSLETDRLMLTPFDLVDVNLLHQTFIHPTVRKYLWDNEIISVEQTRDILLRNHQSFKSNSYGLWKIKVISNHAFAGFAGLWFFFDEPQPQLLYGLLPDETGKGYATEASKAIIDFAFNKLDFDYLIASCNSPNEKSKRVCERLKMKFVEEKQISGRPTTFFRDR